ncbi:MAG: hypothetical protein K1Y01_07720 [Vicinamibacteria bacterium]|nr:hypothetical protein [Vicinamibacteria bacterium]
MTSRESPREMLARAFALALEAMDAYLECPRPVRPRGNPEEVMTGAQAAMEARVTTTAVAKWCLKGLIVGARQRRRRGHWRFPRSAWEAFLASHRIRRRRG